jgi:hypothetical protein
MSTHDILQAQDDKDRAIGAGHAAAHPRAGGWRGRAMKWLTAGGVALALFTGPALSASAATSTSIGVAAATSYGFKCSASGWVHENWPNISVRSARLQNVYVRAFLYRSNGRSWGLPIRVSPWYVGVSNVSGRHVLGYTAGYGLVGHQPYWFALAGHPSVVPPNDGYYFPRLQRGVYTTVEQYYAAGKYWNAQNYYQGTRIGTCTI